MDKFLIETLFLWLPLVFAIRDVGYKEWFGETILYIDASLFWGNVVSQIPGGFLAYYFPSNKAREDFKSDDLFLLY